MSSIWKQYYSDTKNSPPSKLLVEAVKYLKNTNDALDLGAGNLKDSKYLLSLNFKKVTALDKEQIPDEIVNEISANNFELLNTSFEEYKFPSDTFDLINAHYSLPFSSSENFILLMQKIKASLTTQGIFVGQFFGEDDEWNTSNSKLIFHLKEKVEEFFKDYEIIKLEEEKRFGKLASGDSKFWHVYHVIARKI